MLTGAEVGGLKEAVTSLDHRPGEGQRPLSRLRRANPNLVSWGRSSLGPLLRRVARGVGPQLANAGPQWVRAPGMKP